MSDQITFFSTVQKNNWPRKNITNIILNVLKAEHKKNGLVSVHLIGDAKMRALNYQYRGKNKTTDVLSFPSDSLGEVGDIFLCLPQIKRQAKTWNVTYQEERVRMLVHGVLHALGYDHIKPGEAKVMFAKQEKYVGKLI